VHIPMPFSVFLSQNSEVRIVGGQYGVRKNENENENENENGKKNEHENENEK
jgi:hypothetical protein